MTGLLYRAVIFAGLLWAAIKLVDAGAWGLALPVLALALFGSYVLGVNDEQRQAELERELEIQR